MADTFVAKKETAMKNGIVIPCYNEAQRLRLDEFEPFIAQHPDYLLCFVNDGSKDNTLEVLQDFQTKYPDRIEVCNLAINQGKAEAVRTGMLHLVSQYAVQTVGFMDADLSTGFDDYCQLVDLLEDKRGSKQLVFGSRKVLEDNQIKRTFFRSLTSKVAGLMIRSILRLPIHDTQCGAKVFHADLARSCFDRRFVTRWLFDVELFIRARKRYGRKGIMNRILEKPLQGWVHVDGSKITLRDSLEIPSQLLKILFTYDIQPNLALAPRKVNAWSRRVMTTLNLL